MSAVGSTEPKAKSPANLGATNTTEPGDRVIVQERYFDAPRALVWKAWSDATHLDKWWGPNGYVNQTFSMEFRVGGSWRYVMHGPDGKDWQNLIHYDEIVANERLVYRHAETDINDPHCFHVTVTFEDAGNRTKVTMRSLFSTAEACAAVKKFGAIEGGQQTLARLAGHLPALAEGTADRSMVLTRLFNAPPKVVFEAWTRPELLARWWGPKEFTLPKCEVDFRVGGAYRMVMRGPDGVDYPFHGHYVELVEDERIVFDAIIEGPPRVEVRTTVTFVEENGKTRLTVIQDTPTDPNVAKGQTAGWSASLEKLGAMLRA